MEKSISEIVDEKMNGDTEFQDSLKDLSDEDKNPLIEAKKKELLDIEVKDLREKADKATKSEDLANNYKKRAESAEAEAKKYKPTEKKVEEEGKVSTKDFYALSKANVPEEDVDDVLEYARFKNISVADALKSSVVKATLQEKSEIRRTATATQTRPTRTQNPPVDGHSIQDDIRSKGENAVPEPGSKEAEALFNARHRKMSE